MANHNAHNDTHTGNRVNKSSFDGWTYEQREGDYGVRYCGNSLHQLFTGDGEIEDEGIERWMGRENGMGDRERRIRVVLWVKAQRR